MIKTEGISKFWNWWINQLKIFIHGSSRNNLFINLAVWYWILKREKTAAFFLYRVTCVILSGTINVYSLYTLCVLFVHLVCTLCTLFVYTLYTVCVLFVHTYYACACSWQDRTHTHIHNTCDLIPYWHELNRRRINRVYLDGFLQAGFVPFSITFNLGCSTPYCLLFAGHKKLCH